MSVAIICAVAFCASMLTFFTGFGLGTLLLPAFAAFFPVEIAVALTGVVHFLNGLFKLVLVGRHADVKVALKFGIPAVGAAFVGALVLSWLADQAPLLTYTLNGRELRIMPVSFVVAVLMLVLAVIELWPGLRELTVPKRYLPLGGLLTGFFGGLSGHQGALRSAFLIRAGLAKEAFIGTGVVVATLVDLTRLTVYSERFFAADLAPEGPLLGAAALAAFAGAFLGNRLLRKIDLHSIEVGVAVLLVLVALGLGSGLL